MYHFFDRRGKYIKRYAKRIVSRGIKAKPRFCRCRFSRTTKQKLSDLFLRNHISVCISHWSLKLTILRIFFMLVKSLKQWAHWVKYYSYGLLRRGRIFIFFNFLNISIIFIMYKFIIFHIIPIDKRGKRILNLSLIIFTWLTDLFFNAIIYLWDLEKEESNYGRFI